MRLSDPTFEPEKLPRAVPVALPDPARPSTNWPKESGPDKIKDNQSRYLLQSSPPAMEQLQHKGVVRGQLATLAPGPTARPVCTSAPVAIPPVVALVMASFKAMALPLPEV